MPKAKERDCCGVLATEPHLTWCPCAPRPKRAKPSKEEANEMEAIYRAHDAACEGRYEPRD